MLLTLETLVKRLDHPSLSQSNVISWGCPVPSFGDLSKAKIATLGLNPSNREFVDSKGTELDGGLRRFHTLRSLGLRRWTNAKAKHLRLINEACTRYFAHNPYDLWFKSLDDIISGTKASFYAMSAPACHLDLIPYATSCKWTDLSTRQRSALLDVAADTLGLLLRDSPVRLLILNGQTVVGNLERITGTSFERRSVRQWTLPRTSGNGVSGHAYTGVITEIAGIRLNRPVTVLGYNHNIQSSFGVTREVKNSIRGWISRTASEVFRARA